MALTLWSDRPLGVKLAALVGAGTMVLGVFAVVTVGALQDTGATAEELLASAEATEDVLLADMMHDAVRADVLQALLSGGTGDLYDGAVTDLADHAATFRAILAEAVADDLSPEVVGAVEAVTPAVEEYLTSADAIVATVATDPATAASAYPLFAEAFAALEDELPTMGDAVAAFGEEAAAALRGPAEHRHHPRARGRRRRRPACSPCSGGSSPARSSARCTRSGPCWPGWRTATCAARPTSPAGTRSGRWPPRWRPRWPTCATS